MFLLNSFGNEVLGYLVEKESIVLVLYDVWNGYISWDYI